MFSEFLKSAWISFKLCITSLESRFKFNWAVHKKVSADYDLNKVLQPQSLVKCLLGPCWVGDQIISASYSNFIYVPSQARKFLKSYCISTRSMIVCSLQSILTVSVILAACLPTTFFFGCWFVFKKVVKGKHKHHDDDMILVLWY